MAMTQVMHAAIFASARYRSLIWCANKLKQIVKFEVKDAG